MTFEASALGVNGLMMYPLTPAWVAAMICSRFTSAVTISTGKARGGRLCANGAQQVDARNLRHVPVRDEHVEGVGLQQRQRRGAIVRFHDVLVPHFLEYLADDLAHRREIVDDQEICGSGS